MKTNDSDNNSNTNFATCTCHMLPPSEIDWGLLWDAFPGSEGKHLFHRIG